MYSFQSVMESGKYKCVFGVIPYVHFLRLTRESTCTTSSNALSAPGRLQYALDTWSTLRSRRKSHVRQQSFWHCRFLALCRCHMSQLQRWVPCTVNAHAGFVPRVCSTTRPATAYMYVRLKQISAERQCTQIKLSFLLNENESSTVG
jgi:hypothetical protein